MNEKARVRLSGPESEESLGAIVVLVVDTCRPQTLSLILSIITASFAQVMVAEKQWHDPQYCRVHQANSSFPDQAIWRMWNRSASGTEEAT